MNPGACRVLKLLSEDPANYKDAPREGIRRVLEEVTGREHPRDAPLDTSRIASIRMGTTVLPHACLVLTMPYIAAYPMVAPRHAGMERETCHHAVVPAVHCCPEHRWRPTRCWSVRANAAAL